MADSTSLGDLLAGIGAGQAVVNRSALNNYAQQGQALAGLRTAQTEDALLSAQRAREEQDASDNLEDTLTNLTDSSGKPLMTPSQASFTATQMKFLHGGAAPALQAVQDMQKSNNMGIVGDPNAAVASRVAAAQANAGKFDVGQFSNVGDQLVNNVDPAAAGTTAGPQVVQTPVSNANVAQKNAQAGQEGAQTALINNEAANPQLYHPTGANNPNAPHGGSMGAVQQRYNQAAAGAGEQLNVEIHNALQIPWGANTGVLGTGINAHPGTDLLSFPLAALKNKMSTEDTQLYTQSVANIGRFMSTLENMGKPASADQVKASVAAFTAQAGDTNMTRLQKLASLSQHAQATIDAFLKYQKNSLDDDQVAYFKQLKQNITDQIPFTLDDVAALRNTTDKGAMSDLNVGQFFAKHSMGTIPPNLTTPAVGAAANPASPAPGAQPNAPSQDYSHLWSSP